jgi:hypothetical protein
MGTKGKAWLLISMIPNFMNFLGALSRLTTLKINERLHGIKKVEESTDF